MNTFPHPCSVVSCVVCCRVKELDARGYPRDAGRAVKPARLACAAAAAGTTFAAAASVSWRELHTLLRTSITVRSQAVGSKSLLSPFISPLETALSCLPPSAHHDGGDKIVGSKAAPFRASSRELAGI
eukprot:1212113-Rhodomonas_salina.3